MSFSCFKGDDVFPKGQTKVPPYLRNYAKTTTNRHLGPDECNDYYQQPVSELDGTIQGRSLGKTDNLPSITKLTNQKPPLELSNAKTRPLGPPEKLEMPSGVADRSEVNRNQLTDLHRAIQARVAALPLEPIDNHPLSGMQCTGQRMSLAETQQNVTKRSSIPSGTEEVKDSFGCDQVVSNGTTTANSGHAVSLNKLYSCLKKMKYRRNETGQYEDLASISMSGRDPGFSRSYFQRVLGANNGCHTQLRGEHEEVFLLLGGKSKPVRFQINPAGLNLLEKEWRVELKARDSVFCNSDEEGLQLLRKFRERFRNNQRTIVDRRTPHLPIPWARHVVHKGRNPAPEEKQQLEQDESGRKLSIHVYLPNAGWEEQRNATPASEIFLPSS